MAKVIRMRPATWTQYLSNKELIAEFHANIDAKEGGIRFEVLCDEVMRRANYDAISDADWDSPAARRK
jgi:hypothetical protein